MSSSLKFAKSNENSSQNWADFLFFKRTLPLLLLSLDLQQTLPVQCKRLYQSVETNPAGWDASSTLNVMEGECCSCSWLETTNFILL